MYAFMTTGTTHFLKSLTEVHPKINFYFMKSAGNTLVYYEENRKKGVFVSGKSYSILAKNGVVEQFGFVSMQHIPVLEDVKPVFEDKMTNLFQQLKIVKGINASRLLKPIRGNTYIIFILWDSENNYLKWNKTEEKFSQLVRQPAYFGERPFTQTYRMLKNNDSKE